MTDTAANTNNEARLQERPQLAALSLEELQDLMKAWKQPVFRARQVLYWCYKGVLDPVGMKNIPAALRTILKSELLCEPLQLINRQKSEDGTRKYVFALKREDVTGKMLESVLKVDIIQE